MLLGTTWHSKRLSHRRLASHWSSLTKALETFLTLSIAPVKVCFARDAFPPAAALLSPRTVLLVRD